VNANLGKSKVLTIEEIRAKAAEYLIRNYGDALQPGLPTPNAEEAIVDWIVPIIARRTKEDLRIVGHLLVHRSTGDVLKSPTSEELKARVHEMFVS
jgi:hypothetical protein